MLKIWHKIFNHGKLKVFYGKFSDARMATLVVKSDNFFSDGTFKKMVLFFFFSDFSCKKHQVQSASCHMCGIYRLKNNFSRRGIIVSKKVVSNVPGSANALEPPIPYNPGARCMWAGTSQIALLSAWEASQVEKGGRKLTRNGRAGTCMHACTRWCAPLLLARHHLVPSLGHCMHAVALSRALLQPNGMKEGRPNNSDTRNSPWYYSMITTVPWSEIVKIPWSN